MSSLSFLHGCERNQSLIWCVVCLSFLFSVYISRVIRFLLVKKKHQKQRKKISKIRPDNQLIQFQNTKRILNLKENKEEYEFFKSVDADLAIVVAYGQIIPKEFLSLTKKGFINSLGCNDWPKISTHLLAPLISEPY
mgnify:CR=1 FL=1